MLEFIQHFEQIAAQFRPIVLIVPGVSAVLLGLFIWLGGLGFRRFLFAVIGAAIGGICGFFMAGRNIMVALVSMGLGAGIAVIFEKIFIIILTAAIAALAGFVVLGWPAIENADTLKQVPPYRTPIDTGYFDVGEVAEIVTEYAAAFGDTLRQVCSPMSLQNWAIIASAGFIFIVAGFFLHRLTSALCCAVVGTTLIFAGMVLLLLYKGAEPLSRIYNGAPFYGAIFAAMTGFGTIEQLLLYRPASKKIKMDGRTDKRKQEPEAPKRVNWRTG